MPSGANGSAEFRVQRLDSVGRIDQSAHVRMESVERNDFGPGPTPALANCRIFPAPRAGFKRRQRSFAAGRVDGAVDVLQRRGDRLAVLIGGKLQAMPQKMDDAGLNRRFGKTATMASGKPLSPSTMAMRMSSTPRVFNSFMTRSQNLAPSFCSSHRPRISLVPSARTPSATYTALLRTSPSSRILTRRASKKTNG